MSGKGSWDNMKAKQSIVKDANLDILSITRISRVDNMGERILLHR